MNGLTIATVVIAVGTTEAKSVIGGKGFDLKPVIGGFILGIFLFGLGSVNAKLASNFCILIIITALLVNGIQVFKVFNTASK